jgi:hypothetical protein
MFLRGIAAAVGISIGASAAAIIGASLTPAWADAEPAKIAAMFDSNGALDASSLGGVHSGLAPRPGGDDEEELRRKQPRSSDTDPLKDNRGKIALPGEPDLANPFTANLTLNGSPVTQAPAQNPPPVASNPPPADNPPASNNPQNTIPITNNSPLGGIITTTSAIGTGVTTILRRNGLLQ